MATLLVFVGVRGAGKTTVLNKCLTRPNLIVLKPSTTRARRSPDESEYDFRNLHEWDSDGMAWEISVGKDRYGMRKSEIDRVHESRIGVTVFDPANISTLYRYKSESLLEIITVGLDTVHSMDEQAMRTGADPVRCMTESDLTQQKKIVESCDVVVRGDVDTICSAVNTIVDIMCGRGGVVPSEMLAPLMKAGTLLHDGDAASMSTASYDLSLGDDVWCQGAFICLSDKSPTLRIPPYSYAIVSAREKAELPNFLSGRFDLKVSLFFQGVILSNGPQVDPGYKGALFCMLYNGSDEPVGIIRGQHFATIEFLTTTIVSAGYKEHYQGKAKLSDFIPANAAVAKGGQILERMLDIEKSMRTEWNALRFGAFTILAVVLSVLTVVSITIWNMRADAIHIIERLRQTEGIVVPMSQTNATIQDTMPPVVGDGGEIKASSDNETILDPAEIVSKPKQEGNAGVSSDGIESSSTSEHPAGD